MLAEEELNSIFSKHKGLSTSTNSMASSVGAVMRFHSSAASNNLNANTQLTNSFSTNASSIKTDNKSSNWTGYSKFDLLEAPLKRPSCNPFTKEE